MQDAAARFALALLDDLAVDLLPLDRVDDLAGQPPVDRFALRSAPMTCWWAKSSTNSTTSGIKIPSQNSF
jgi:hypothetical protein